MSEWNANILALLVGVAAEKRLNETNIELCRTKDRAMAVTEFDASNWPSETGVQMAFFFFGFLTGQRRRWY